MKLLKQIRTAIFIIVALTAASSAGAETRHILERGETLESVAKKYGITTEQIIALNPDAKSFTYVGVELIIPETATTRSDSAAAASTGTAATPAPVAVSSGNTYSYTATPQTSASQTISQSAPYAPEPERTIFNMNASINYYYAFTGSGGDFKTRSAYGLSIEGASNLTENFGAGLFFAGNANYGLVDSGGIGFAIGPTAMLAFNSSRTVGLSLPLCVGLAYTDKTYWSFITVPHLTAVFNRVVASLGCSVNVASVTSASLYIGLGYQF